MAALSPTHADKQAGMAPNSPNGKGKDGKGKDANGNGGRQEAFPVNGKDKGL